MITAFGREVLRKARIAFGLGIVENGYDETARVQAFLPADLEAGERALLRDAKAWMARLPFDSIDLLVVDEMGKDISGTGMDSNIIGRHGTFFEPAYTSPRITFIVACDLTAHTYGNAIGIGMADFTTTRLVNKIERSSTYMNALTALSIQSIKVPPHFETDREAVSQAVASLALADVTTARVVRIVDTLTLETVEASEALAAEAKGRADLEVVRAPGPMQFDSTGLLLPIGA